MTVSDSPSFADANGENAWTKRYDRGINLSFVRPILVHTCGSSRDRNLVTRKMGGGAFVFLTGGCKSCIKKDQTVGRGACVAGEEELW